MSHRLLKRQLNAEGLDANQLPTDLTTWKRFLEKVERAYLEADRERLLMEHSIEISSQEMHERWTLIEADRVRSIHSEKMAALGVMSAGVAHEINNPLALIKTIAGQMQELLEEEPLYKPLLIDMLKRIETTTGRIASIINGLRIISREGDKDPFDKASLKTLVEDTLAVCETAFKQANIELVITEIEKDLFLSCRPSQIAQVLMNLLQNARDAIANFEKKWIKVSAEKKDDFLEIVIEDCGKGIPLEIQRKIFDPFFTTKDPGKGTGLGLSLSKQIIEDHGGSLTIDAECPNTRFVLRLPHYKPKGGRRLGLDSEGDQ